MIYFKLKNVSIKHKGILAPMQEYSHLPFRLLCKKYGAGMTFTEMVNIHHILSNKESLEEIDLLKSTKEENTAIQLFGDFSLKKTIDAISLIDEYKYFKVIDLNLGCPSLKIINSKAGSYNLKQIDKILPIIKEATSITKKPITIKTRLGFSKNEILKIAPLLEKTNISGITIHGRLAKENYSHNSNALAVKEVFKKLSIPVIYNGDINDDNFKEYLDFQGLMVARASLGNPLIFNNINNFLEKETKKVDKRKVLFEFLKLLKKHPIPFSKVKVSLIPFFKGKVGSYKIREEISKAKSLEEIIEILNKQEEL